VCARSFTAYTPFTLEKFLLSHKNKEKSAAQPPVRKRPREKRSNTKIYLAKFTNIRVDSEIHIFHGSNTRLPVFFNKKPQVSPIKFDIR